MAFSMPKVNAANKESAGHVDSNWRPMDAVEHLNHVRSITVRVFVCMVVGLFLLHGAFGLMRRCGSSQSSRGAAATPLEFKMGLGAR